MIAATVLLLVSGTLMLSIPALCHGLWLLAAAVLLVAITVSFCLRGRRALPACVDGLLICASALCGIAMLEGLPPWIPIASLSLFLFSWNTARIHASTCEAHVLRREERRAATRLLIPAVCLTAALSAGLDLIVRTSLVLRFETALLLGVGSLIALGVFLFLLGRHIAPPHR